MWKVIIPVQPLFAPIYLIAIGSYKPSLKIQFFSHPQSKTLCKKDLSLRYPRVWASRPNHQCGTLNDRTVKQFGYETIVPG